MGPTAGLDGCGKSRPHRDSIPGPVSPLQSLSQLPNHWAPRAISPGVNGQVV